MAQIPGERFQLDFDDDSIAPHEKPRSAQSPGFVGDVLEREITAEIAPPTFKGSRSATGFPEHKKRTGVSKFKQGRGAHETEAVTTPISTVTPEIAVQSPLTPADKHGALFEKEQIDAENKKTIASMSASEIESERQELFAGLSPALIEKLLKRSNIDDEASRLEPSASPKAKAADTENRRPSQAERRVSFALPDEEIQKAETTSTASRHSITSSPSPLVATKLGESNSSDVPELGLSRTTSNASGAGSRRSSLSPGFDRKVSFVLPDYIELARKASPTAAKHSISSPMTIASDKKEAQKHDEVSDLDLTRIPSGSAMKSPGALPVDHRRKVSFALPDSQIVPEGRRLSSAASHSIASTPSPRFVDKVDPLPASPIDDFKLSQAQDASMEAPEGSVHFPKPPAAPELDPNAPTFLDDLHQKYFPSLAHDPSKLAWMAPATAEENAAYDPSSENLDPKDVRFDFKGKIIPPSQSARIPTDVGLHHHGDAPSAAGYTIGELGILSRSAFPAQRSIAMQTAGRILYRLGKGEFGNENLVQAEGPVGERGMLAKGLWEAVEENRIIDTITAEASKESGHQTSIALAQEAVWNWRKGGGRQRKAV